MPSPRASKNERGILRRLLPILVTVCLGAGVSVGVFVAAQEWEEARLRATFERAAQDQAAVLGNLIQHDLMLVGLLERFYAGSEKVERDEFHEFVKPVPKDIRCLQALEWVPRVPASERAAFETAAQAEGLAGFQITERDADGRMVRAGPRDEYFPVHFVEPLAGNEQSLGFDLGSEPTRRAALEAARDSGAMRGTGRIRLIQETGDQWGILVLVPVYRNDASLETVEERRAELAGFVLGAFRVGDLLERATSQLGPRGIDVALYDASAPVGERLLAWKGSCGQHESAAPAETDLLRPVGLHHAATFRPAGRTWVLVCTPCADFLATAKEADSWALLAGGLAFTALLAAYFGVTGHRAAEVERMAGRLLEGNEQLQAQVAERRRMEDKLRRLGFIAQQAAEGIAVADLAGNLQFVNDAWARMHGYESGAEFVGKHLRVFHTDEQLKTDVIPFNDVVTQRGYSAGEIGHVRKDGTTFPAQMMVTLLKDEQGEPYGLAGFAQDVTNRKRAEEERQKTLHRQQGISLLSQSLLAAGALEGKLKTVTDAIVRLFDADFCRVWLIRPGDFCERGCVHAEVHEGPHVCRYRDRCLHLLASSGRYTHTDGKGHRRVPFGCYKIGRVASGQEHKFLTNDAVNDPRVHNHQWARELGLVAFAGYQLRAPGGETLGVLALFAKHPISPEEDAMLDALSSAVALVAQQAAAETALQQANVRLEELATTDALTGLANRRRFLEVLETEFQRSRRYGGRLTLAMVDVDRFKRFNDTHGHAFGDRVLVEVAKRLVAEARQTDVVARLGGDEFVILTPETSGDEAVRAAERIRQILSRHPVSEGEQSALATISVGIATVENGKAGTPESLLKQADDAMYAAKEAGRNCVRMAGSKAACQTPSPTG